LPNHSRILNFSTFLSYLYPNLVNFSCGWLPMWVLGNHKIKRKKIQTNLIHENVFELGFFFSFFLFFNINFIYLFIYLSHLGYKLSLHIATKRCFDCAKLLAMLRAYMFYARMVSFWLAIESFFWMKFAIAHCVLRIWQSQRSLSTSLKLTFTFIALVVWLKISSIPMVLLFAPTSDIVA